MTREVHSITVFVAGSDLGTSVRDIAHRWASEGLAEAAVWIDHTDALAAEGPLARYAAVGDSESTVLADVEPVDLPYALRGRAYDTVRLVVLQLIARPEDVDVSLSLVDAGRAVQSALRTCLPARTNLVALNVVVPATSVDGLPRDLLIPGWDANIVVSPEDAASADQARMAVRHPGNFVGHAAMHALTIGAAFLGQRTGPFDDGAPASSGQATDPIVVRGFGRAIMCRPFFADLAGETLASRDHWQVPVMTPPAVPAAAPEQMITDALRAAGDLERGAFRFRAFGGLPQPIRREVGLRLALRLMFSSVVARLRGLPRQVGSALEARGRSEATRLVQAITGLGEQSALVPTFGGRGEQLVATADATRVAHDAQRIADVVAVIRRGDVPVEAARGDAWARLCGAAFAMVDGGPVAAPFEPALFATNRQVITAPALIAPDAECGDFRFAGLQLPSRLTTEAIRTCDARKARLVRDALEAERAAATTEQEALASTDDEAAEAADAESDRIAGFDAALAQLDTWEQPRRPAFFWRLAELLGSQVDTSLGALRASLPALENGEPESNASTAKKARRHLRGWLALCSVLALLAGWVALRGHTWLFDVPVRAAAVVVGVAAAIFSVATWGYLRYCRDMFALEYSLQRARSTYDHNFEAACTAVVETARLSALYEELLDCGETVGWIVHHPWGRVTPARVEGEDLPTETYEMPEALQLGHAATSPDTLKLLRNRFSRDLFTAGWLSSAYQRYAHAALERAAHVTGMAFDSLGAGEDLLWLPAARTVLLDELRAGKAACAEREALLRRLSDFCAAQSPTDVLDAVRPIRDPSHLTDADSFLTGVVTPGEGWLLDTLYESVSGRGKVARSTLWLADGISVPTTDGLEISRSRPVIDAMHNYVPAALLLETTDAVPIDEVAIFSPPEPEPPPNPPANPGGLQ